MLRDYRQLKKLYPECMKCSWYGNNHSILRLVSRKREKEREPEVKSLSFFSPHKRNKTSRRLNISLFVFLFIAILLILIRYVTNNSWKDRAKKISKRTEGIVWQTTWERRGSKFLDSWLLLVCLFRCCSYFFCVSLNTISFLNVFVLCLLSSPNVVASHAQNWFQVISQ